jgi:hypothetical protein
MPPVFKFGKTKDQAEANYKIVTNRESNSTFVWKTASGSSKQNVWVIDGVSMAPDSLSESLRALGENLRASAATPVEIEAAEHVVNASAAAKIGDGSGLLNSLKSAGRWAFDISTKIGTTLATEVIKRALQI